MSHKNYSEYEPTDDEITEALDEIYPDDVIICGMSMSQSYVLKHMDRIAFDSFASDTMRWYRCDSCGVVYKSDDSEEEARECCQEYCNGCGDDLPDGESGLCETCQEEADESEETEEE